MSAAFANIMSRLKARWRSVQPSLYSPAIFLAVSAVLMWIASKLVLHIDHQSIPLAVFTLGALIAFHLVGRRIAWLSDERTYKIVDYIYLGLCLLGLVSVIDVQSENAKDQISRAGLIYAFLAE